MTASERIHAIERDRLAEEEARKEASRPRVSTIPDLQSITDQVGKTIEAIGPHLDPLDAVVATVDDAISSKVANDSPRSGTDARGFWAEALRRQWIFFAAWVGWPIVGIPLTAIWWLVLPGDNLLGAGTAALFTWGPVFLWAAHRFDSIKCFNCGEKAFGSVLARVKGGQCKNCGTRYVSA